MHTTRAIRILLPARSSCLAAVLAILAPALSAQAAAPAAAFDPRNLSGFWELPYDGRNIPAAKLQASVTPAVLAERAAQDANSRRWCYFIGMPMAMESPRPIDAMVHPLRDGNKGGSLFYITKADGSRMYTDIARPKAD